MVRLEDILEKVASYNPQADLDIIRKAYVFSGMVHKGQHRLSGEPYLSHPIEVTEILTSLKMDASCVATGLLHDTVEDTHTTIEKIEEVFGEEVAGLVEGLTKISRITFEKKEDHEAENFRKMLLAMARDIRIVIIKLADRLHNMRTLDALPRDKQIKIARETMDIYAPIANRIGINWMKGELEDLAFKYLEPDNYKYLKEQVQRSGREREGNIQNIKEEIEKTFKEHEIECRVLGRPKHIYSIFKKMSGQELDLVDIHDVVGFRVIVKSVRDCYIVLGVIHSTWKPVPGRFKDYIGIPKPNLYQSLHTTVIGPENERMEIQIRTEEMNRTAEYGIAAHWKYKEDGLLEGKDYKSFAWLRQLLEWQNDLKDSDEFMETVKVDLFPEDVFVFTPQGSVKELPIGATPVDFAYAIHTDVGNRCAGAKVNGKIVPLKQVLRNGNVIEIITSSFQTPSKDWLDFAVTSKARTRIKQWIRTEEREKSVRLGKEILEKELKKYNLDYDELIDSGELLKVSKEDFQLKDVESLQMNVGFGKISIFQFLSKLVPIEKLRAERDMKMSRLSKVLGRFKSKSKARSETGGVIIKGVEDIMVKFAKCCNPLPGDDIIGFVSQGQGVTVHSSHCPVLLNIDRERQVDVEWDKGFTATMPVKIQVTCKNEKGLLAKMSDAILNADSNITNADIRTTVDDNAVNIFEVEVSNTKHLKDVIRALQKVKKVKKVVRVTGDNTV